MRQVFLLCKIKSLKFHRTGIIDKRREVGMDVGGGALVRSGYNLGNIYWPCSHLTLLLFQNCCGSCIFLWFFIFIN